LRRLYLCLLHLPPHTALLFHLLLLFLSPAACLHASACLPPSLSLLHFFDMVISGWLISSHSRASSHSVVSPACLSVPHMPSPTAFICHFSASVLLPSFCSTSRKRKRLMLFALGLLERRRRGEEREERKAIHDLLLCNACGVTLFSCVFLVILPLCPVCCVVCGVFACSLFFSPTSPFTCVHREVTPSSIHILCILFSYTTFSFILTIPVLCLPLCLYFLCIYVFPCSMFCTFSYSEPE